MKSISLQEAHALIENAAAVICDDNAVVFPIVNPLTGDLAENWLEIKWEEEGMDYEFFVTEAPQEIKFDGTNVYLKDNTGEDTTITLLHRAAIPLTPEVEEWDGSFDPENCFESPDQVIECVNELPLAMRSKAFWAAVQANVDMGECGFAGEVVALFEDLDLTTAFNPPTTASVRNPPTPLQSCAFMPFSELLPERWESWFFEYFSESAPFSWGDNNRTLITADRVHEWCKHALRDAAQDTGEDQANLDEFMDELKALRTTYIDLEN